MINESDRRFLEEVPGRDKLKALLAARKQTLTDFAKKHGHWVQDVSLCLKGAQPLPVIRDSLASELELPRSEIDRLIDGGEKGNDQEAALVAPEED